MCSARAGNRTNRQLVAADANTPPLSSLAPSPHQTVVVRRSEREASAVAMRRIVLELCSTG